MSKSALDVMQQLEQCKYDLQQERMTRQISEARFHNIITKNADSIIILNRQGIIRFVNTAAELLFARNSAELIGSRFGFPVINGETTEIEIVQQAGDIVIGEMCVTETEWEGETSYLATVRDITERKRNEESLRLFESALQNSNDFIIITTAILKASYPAMVFANRAFTEATGYTLAECYGKTPQLLYGPNTDLSIIEQLRRNLAQGQIFYGEMINYRKDGTEINLEWNVAPIRDELGTVTNFVIIQRDITERKRAETERTNFIREQIARTEAEAAGQRLAFLAEASSLLARSLNYVTTLAGMARLAVPKFADWCAVDVIEEDQSIRRFTVAYADGLTLESWDVDKYLLNDTDAACGPLKVIRTGQPELVSEMSDAMLMSLAGDIEQYKNLHKQQVKSYICVPVVDRGRILGAITFVLTVSDRTYQQADLVMVEDLARRAALAIDNARLYSSAQTANRLKDEFLVTISHELRTPLTSMLGWIRLLQVGKLNDTCFKNGLDTIERNTKALTQIVDDLLDVSRIITGKISLNIGVIELAPIIEAVVAALKLAANAKSINLSMILHPGISPIKGDPDRIQQIIWNLVSNAIKFTPAGGRVEVRLEQNESHIEITVTDTGRGIDKEFLNCVFDRFLQADGSITRSVGGLGLGLAIVRHLVELHGGTVQASSDGYGQGATFKIRFPLGSVQMQLSAVKQIKNEERSCTDQEYPNIQGLSLMVVDDDMDTCELIKVFLAQYGAQVKYVSSVAEALVLAAQWQPDILISDISLPDEDGYTLIKMIRSFTAEQGGEIPAIALTAYARDEDRKRALLAGFDRYLPKPFELNELVSVISNLVN